MLKIPKWAIRWLAGLSGMLALFAAVGAFSDDPAIKKLATGAAWALAVLIVVWLFVGLVYLLAHIAIMRAVKDSAPLMRQVLERVSAISSEAGASPTPNHVIDALGSVLTVLALK